MITLETDRLYLRPLTLDDREHVHLMHSDPETVRYAWIARDHWGRGLATEAATASRDHGFQTLRRGRVISIIHPDNRASRRVAEKVGLRVDKPAIHKGIDVLVYAMESTDGNERG